MCTAMVTRLLTSNVYHADGRLSPSWRTYLHCSRSGCAYMAMCVRSGELRRRAGEAFYPLEGRGGMGADGAFLARTEAVQHLGGEGPRSLSKL